MATPMRRVVAIGRISVGPSQTREITYAVGDVPQYWNPQTSPEPDELDIDDIRKRKIEGDLANG